MTDIKFDFEHLSFLSNYQTNEQYSKIGLAELFGAAQMSGGDHSAFFNGFSKLIEALESALPNSAIIAGVEHSENAPREMDLTDLLSLKCENGVPSAVYGGALQVHPEMGLVLSFGTNHFAVAQSGKTLSIGSLTGELKILDKKREDQSVYWTLFWEVALSDDYDVFFAIPIKKDPADPKGEKPLALDKDIFKRDILAKNNLASFVREQSTGKFTNYGNCPRVDGSGDPLKPKKMQDGTYILTGIAHGVLTNKEDGKEFDSVLGYLADGTRISLNSFAQKDFLENPNSFRFPLQWKMNHLDANRTRSTLCNISAPVAPKTVLPSRFAAFANMALSSASLPTKSALIGGSSADFEKLEAVQTKIALPTKNASVAGGQSDDECF